MRSMPSDDDNKPDLDGSSVESVSLRNPAKPGPSPAGPPAPAKRGKPTALLWLAPLAIGILGIGGIALWQWLPDDDLPWGEPPYHSDDPSLQDRDALPATDGPRADASEADAREARDAARQARQSVDDEALAISASLREFGRGETRFEAGDTAFADGNWNRARDLFEQAKDGFQSAMSLAAQHADAVQARDTWQSRLEALSPLDLARHVPQPWQQAQTAATGATQAFTDDRFAVAAEMWQSAAAALDNAEADLNERIREAMAAGVEALSAGNRQQALDAFNQLRELQPDHPQLEQLLQRAETIEQVKALLSSAARHEEQGDLELARIDYRRALDIDSLSLDARSGIARTTAAITNTLFTTTIEEGRKYFDQEDFAAAVQSFEQALTLKPGDSTATNLLRRARDAFEARELRRLTTAATAAEAGREWQQALDLYNQALAVNSGYVAAAEGVERVSKIIAEQERFADLVQRSASLANRSDYDQAIILLRQAGLIRPDDTTIPEQITALQRKLIEQEKPVSVTFISDGQSSIHVYRVGVLGQIERRTIDLRPGEYTVVASRTGYRSVRRTLTIEAGSEPVSLTIQCTDRI